MKYCAKKIEDNNLKINIWLRIVYVTYGPSVVWMKDMDTQYRPMNKKETFEKSDTILSAFGETKHFFGHQKLAMRRSLNS